MIEKIAEALVDFARKQPPGALSKVIAHLLLPGFVMAWALSGVYSPSMAFDSGEPIRVAELSTEIDTLGRVTQKAGIALTVEPVTSEYSVPLNAASAIWVSLDPQTAKANVDRLVITPTELRGKSPFMGVSTPVTVIVVGQSKGEIWIPGGTEQLKNWRLEPRRSIAFLSNILLVCVFVFGMSLAFVLPPRYSIEDTAAEVSANPD